MGFSHYNKIENSPTSLTHNSVLGGLNNFKYGTEKYFMVLRAMSKFGGIHHNLRNHILMTSYENHH